MSFFTDPLLRGPIFGSLLMSLVAALVGVLVFVRKRSLIGETLSHATYPGVTLAVIIAPMVVTERYVPLLILVGAFGTAVLGYLVVHYLERYLRVSNDAALCAVLALFFGMGITIGSYAQFFHTRLFRQIQAYLYGQAATMGDQHIVIYAVLACLVVAVIRLFYKEILILSFDGEYAKVSGMPTKLVDRLILLLIALAVVVGIRSVGVILMSGMLIAPAAAARQFTNRLSQMFWLSALFGVCSACVGTCLSIYYRLPTGPAIVLIAGGVAVVSLFFAPERGLVIRYLRIMRFRSRSLHENTLKTFWHETRGGKKAVDWNTIDMARPLLLWNLRLRGWITRSKEAYHLTPAGVQRGGQIVRLHRLWEAYLVHSLGLRIERVHKSAEEMEHILTPELEKKLTKLLDNPTQDPHDQPIPTQEELHG